jgi:hypothetical protein
LSYLFIYISLFFQRPLFCPIEKVVRLLNAVAVSAAATLNGARLKSAAKALVQEILHIVKRQNVARELAVATPMAAKHQIGAQGYVTSFLRFTPTTI